MKPMLTAALGLTLAFVGQVRADDLQWQPVTKVDGSPLPNPSRMDAPSIIWSEPVRLTQPSNAAPFTIRTVRAKSTDDDSKPLPPGVQTAPSLMPQVDLGRMQPIQPETTQKSGGKIVPMPDQFIPVEPGVVIEDNGTPVSSSCGCGLNMPSLGGDCGSCCNSMPAPLYGRISDWWHSHWSGAGSAGWLSTSSCLDGCCMDCCCYNGNRNHMWFTAEYLLWQFSNPNAPPLVTTGTAGTVLPGAAPLTTGPALGQSGTTTVIGNDTFSNLTRSGVRFDFGMWFPGCENLGFDINALYFPQITSTYGANGQIVGRPFLNVTPGNPPYQSTQAVNGFNATTGTVNASYYSQVWGVELNARYKLCCGPNFKVDLLGGYRNFNLVEGISVTENLLIGGAGGIQNQISDNFNTSNSFNGGQIGVDAEWRFLPRWSLGGIFKLAVGDVHQVVNINGSQSNPFGITNYPSNLGVFATNTNVGNYSRDTFAILPEVGVKLGVDINSHVRLFIAYNFIYLSNAVRPGDTIDTTINTNNQVGGTPGNPPRPAFVFNNSSFYAHGVSAGLDIHY